MIRYPPMAGGKRLRKNRAGLEMHEFIRLNRDPEQWFCLIFDGDGFARIFGIGATEQEARDKAVEAIRQYGKIESRWPWTIPPSEV